MSGYDLKEKKVVNFFWRFEKAIYCMSSSTKDVPEKSRLLPPKPILILVCETSPFPQIKSHFFIASCGAYKIRI